MWLVLLDRVPNGRQCPPKFTSRVVILAHIVVFGDPVIAKEKSHHPKLRAPLVLSAKLVDSLGFHVINQSQLTSPLPRLYL